MFLTNFNPIHYELYKQAIKIYEEEYPTDKDNFYLLRESHNGNPLDNSLWYKGSKRDLSEFWRIFDKLKKDPKYNYKI